MSHPRILFYAIIYLYIGTLIFGFSPWGQEIIREQKAQQEKEK